MSDPNIVALGDFCPVKVTIKNLDKLAFTRVGSENTCSGPMDWSVHRSEKIFEWLKKRSSFTPIQKIPKKFTLLERSQIKRVLASLQGYYSSASAKIPREELLPLVVYPNGAKTLKNIRFKSFLETCDGIPMEYPDWWKSTKSYKIYDIGDIFNYQYCFHWKTEVDDFKIMETPVVFADGALEEFRNAIREYIADWVSLETILEEEILLSSSGSAALYKGTTVPLYELLQKADCAQISKKRQPVKRTVIYASPNGERDTIINTPQDLFRIKWIEYELSMLLQRNSGNVVPLNPDKFQKKLKGYLDDYKLFLCRDIKKEGLTKPRELLKIILEELKNKFPEKRAFHVTDFYETLRYVDYPDFEAKRGHGLGMANSLTTLMQIGLHLMVLKRMTTQQGEIDFITHNDDLTVCFTSEDDFEEFWSCDAETLDDLSIIQSTEKSFRMKQGFVFCERYLSYGNPLIGKKASYKRRELLTAFIAVNITHAKSIVSSLTAVEPDILEELLPQIISFWGFEFFREEYLLPASVGGWYTPTLFSLDLTLRLLEENELYSFAVIKAYEACKFNKVKPKFQKGMYFPPIKRIFPRFKPEEDVAHFFDYGSWNDVYEKYSRLKLNPDNYFDCWNYLKKKRSFIYNKTKLHLDFPSFCKYYTKECERDVYLPDRFIERYVRQERIKAPYRDLYATGNPLISYIATRCPVQVENIIPNSWQLRANAKERVNIRLTSDERKRLKRYVGVVDLSQKIDKGTFVMPVEEQDFQDLQEAYMNPFSVSKLAGEGGLLGIPIPRREFWNPKTKFKKEIYGRFLTKDEYFFYLDIPVYLIKLCIDSKLALKKIQKIKFYNPPKKIEYIQPSKADEFEEIDDKQSFDQFVDERKNYKVYKELLLNPNLIEGPDPEIPDCYPDLKKVQEHASRARVLLILLRSDLLSRGENRENFLRELDAICDDIPAYAMVWGIGKYAKPHEEEELEPEFMLEF
jgi:hypothetical protein